MTSARANDDPIKGSLLEAAHLVLEQAGPVAMTVRAIAEKAGISTMAVYSRFGGKANILEALYLRGFGLLREQMEKVAVTKSSVQDITELAFAYRRFALDNPGLYGFMFERPVPGFDPSLGSRQEGLRTTFEILAESVGAFIDDSMGGGGDRTLVSYVIWSALHGELSLELTHSVRTPLPGWLPAGPESAERVYRQMVETVLSGLAIGGQARVTN